MDRRAFMAQAGTACAAGMLGLSLALYARQTRALPAAAIRPPGAMAEDDFLSRCVRCGLCVRACPYDTLSLAEAGDAAAAGATVGTPFFTPRTVPCEMCEDVPCAKACPTGALDREIKSIDVARMGLAVLIDQETCLNFNGLRCDVCYRVCPVIDKAITLEMTHNERTGKHAFLKPVVHSDHCTGCGKCEHSCVLEVAAIKVLPTALAKGGLGKHYKLGWKEKERAGKALINDRDMIDLPDRGLDATGGVEKLPGAGLREGGGK